MVEAAAAVRSKARDLAIEDGVLHGNGVRDLFDEEIELVERHAATRHQLTLMAANVRKNSKPVVFQFTHPIAMIELAWNSNERHRFVKH